MTRSVVVPGATIEERRTSCPYFTLPSLVAGRTLAADWVRDLGPIEGDRVVVNASPLVSSTASFAAQLVRSALVDARAGALVVVSGPADFGNDVKLAAEEIGVSARLHFALDDPALHP